MSETCEVLTGWYWGGAVPVAGSLEGAWACDEPAAVTTRSACVHEHVTVRRCCTRHGDPDPPGAVVLCRRCAELGHDCPVQCELVTA
jgi:hypothetical protein